MYYNHNSISSLLFVNTYYKLRLLYANRILIYLFPLFIKIIHLEWPDFKNRLTNKQL